MPSGKSIDWTLYDASIISELPSTTIVALATKLGLHPRPLGVRAKKLGVQPAPKIISNEHKNRIAQSVSKPLTVEQRQYLIDNYKSYSRRQLARELGLSYYLVNKEMNALGLAASDEIRIGAMLDGAKRGAKLGANAFRHRLHTDKEFAERWSAGVSIRSKQLWKDDIYRLKVRNGIRTVYADSDLKQRLSILGKERYLNDPSVQAILSAPRPFKNSKLNDDVAAVLDGHGIIYEREYEINNYKFDFKIGDILLEVNGDYWHNLTDNVRNDRAKATIIQLYHPNLQLRVLWEREFRSVRGKDRLLEVIGLSTRQPTNIDLKDVTFKLTDNNLSNRFLSSFHYLGGTNRCRYVYGAFLHGELIGVAVFGPLVRQNITKTKAIELVRLCRHPHFHNQNLMSKFLSWCCRDLKQLNIYDQIISYADTTIHEGTIYRACNWRDEGLCQPDYQYISKEGVPMHKKTLYNRAKAAALTEKVYAELHGYRKVYAGQKRRFVCTIG